MHQKKGATPPQIETLFDHWKRLVQVIDTGLISSEHATIAVAAATKLLLESGAYLDEEGNWTHPQLRR